MCEKNRADPGSVEVCDWHEVYNSLFYSGNLLKSLQNLGKLEPGALFPTAIWTLEDILEYGREQGICPYFAIRRMVRL